MRLKALSSTLAAALILSLPALSATPANPATSAAPAAQAKATTAATAAPAAGPSRPGKSAPDFTLLDAGGKSHSLSGYRGKWVVLEWVNYDCPFVRKHYGSGNMQKHQQAARDKGAVWLSINSSAPGKQGHFEGVELTKRILDAKAASDAYLVDGDGKVGKAYKAKTTPHMFVIDPEGRIAYSGAIDDKPSTDLADVAGARNYVQAALESGMAGKPLETASTASYGCAVKYGP